MIKIIKIINFLTNGWLGGYLRRHRVRKLAANDNARRMALIPPVNVRYLAAGGGLTDSHRAVCWSDTADRPRQFNQQKKVN